jgi:hypothetical protein
MKEGTINAAFWFHLFITMIAWFGPFLISWQIMLIVYAIVQLQFAVLGQCIVNKHHDLDDVDNDYTFYAFLFEQLGFRPHRARLRFFVRRVSNWFYSAIAVIWQVVLDFEPILF